MNPVRSSILAALASVAPPRRDWTKFDFNSLVNAFPIGEPIMVFDFDASPTPVAKMSYDFDAGVYQGAPDLGYLDPGVYRGDTDWQPPVGWSGHFTAGPYGDGSLILLSAIVLDFSTGGETPVPIGAATAASGGAMLAMAFDFDAGFFAGDLDQAPEQTVSDDRRITGTPPFTAFYYTPESAGENRAGFARMEETLL